MSVWLNCPLGGPALALLQAVAEASNEQGNCYLPMAALAVNARMHRCSAHRALKLLRDKRYIVTSRVLGKGATLVYQLNVPLIERSRRDGFDQVRTEAQRNRCTGPTEAGLIERTQRRKPESLDATATSRLDYGRRTATRELSRAEIEEFLAGEPAIGEASAKPMPGVSANGGRDGER